MVQAQLNGGKESTQLLVKSNTDNLQPGQDTMANSIPVVIASNQSAVEVKGTAAVGAAPSNPPLAIAGVDATSGFKQYFRLVNLGGLFNLATDISSWFGSTAPTVGQKTMINSIPVVLSSDQASIPVTLPVGTHTLTSSVVVANGSVAAGARSVSALFSTSFTGTFNGVSRAAGTTLMLNADQGKTLPLINYTVTAGDITIDIIT